MLSENQLAEFIGKSRTPVREAIRRLEADGVLESKKGIGTFLKVLSIKDMYEVRESLELIAAKTAIHTISDDEIVALKKDFEDLWKTDIDNEEINGEKFSMLDTKIHELILENSSNQFAKILMAQINFNCQRYRRLFFQSLKKISANIYNGPLRFFKKI